MCNTSRNGCYCTLPGVPSLAISDWLSFDSVILSGEEEADKTLRCAVVRIRSGVWEGCYVNVELDILEVKGGGDFIYNSLEIFSWTK